MNWSLGSNCSGETGNSKNPIPTNNALWKNKYIPVGRGMRNHHCIQWFGTNYEKSVLAVRKSAQILSCY